MPRRPRVTAGDQQFGPMTKKTTSLVWSHFEVPVEPIHPQWAKRVRCVECQRPFTWSGSTSALRRQMEFQHPERFHTIQEQDPGSQNVNTFQPDESAESKSQQVTLTTDF